MSKIVDIPLADTVPSVEIILSAQGIPTGRTPEARTTALAEEARQVYRRLARPVGMVQGVSVDDMRAIYDGEGANADQSVLDEILPHAVSLTLFSITVGEPLCLEITRLFDRNDFAEATMLDAAASSGADLAAERIQELCEEELRNERVIGPAHGVLRFSPGYCGWHVSGQRRLFARLRPQEIGIRLNQSCLMQPLKSVSGVVVAAPTERFDVDDTYPYCADCTTHSCRDRFEALKQKALTRNTGN